MARLWRWLTATYGSSFISQFGAVGERTYRIWAQELAQYNEKEFQHAVEALRKSNEKFLTLPLIRSYMQAQHQRHKDFYDYQIVNGRHVNRLPKPTYSKAMRLKHHRQNMLGVLAVMGQESKFDENGVLIDEKTK